MWLAIAAFWLPDAGLAEENGTGRVKEQVELEPMVVTAEKREGDAWKIPGGISVVGDGRIEDFRLNSVRDIVAVVLNFYVTDTGMTDQSFASMRGIGSSMTGTPTVGVYVDNVYVQPTSSDFFSRSHISAHTVTELHSRHRKQFVERFQNHDAGQSGYLPHHRIHLRFHEKIHKSLIAVDRKSVV